MAVHGANGNPYAEALIPRDPRIAERRLLENENKTLTTILEALQKVLINGGTTADFTGNHEVEAAIELGSKISFNIITDGNREYYRWDSRAQIDVTINAIQKRLDEIKTRL